RLRRALLTLLRTARRLKFGVAAAIETARPTQWKRRRIRMFRQFQAEKSSYHMTAGIPARPVRAGYRDSRVCASIVALFLHNYYLLWSSRKIWRFCGISAVGDAREMPSGDCAGGERRLQ